MAFETKLTTQMTSAASNAALNELMENPFTMVEVSQSNSALIMRVDNPRVRRVIGRVRIAKMGRMTEFNNPKITATTSAVYMLATSIPGRYWPIRKMVIAMISQRMMNIYVPMVKLVVAFAVELVQHECLRQIDTANTDTIWQTAIRQTR